MFKILMGTILLSFCVMSYAESICTCDKDPSDSVNTNLCPVYDAQRMEVIPTPKYKVGDEVVFLYFSNDSQKEVEQRGIILIETQDGYFIFPKLKIHPFLNYLFVEKGKVTKICNK